MRQKEGGFRLRRHEISKHRPPIASAGTFPHAGGCLNFTLNVSISERPLAVSLFQFSGYPTAFELESRQGDPLRPPNPYRVCITDGGIVSSLSEGIQKRVQESPPGVRV